MTRKGAFAEAGYTMLEVATSTAIAGLLGLAAVTMVQVGRDTHDKTRVETHRSQGVREAARRLGDEIKQTKAACLAVTKQIDGNCEIVFQRPVAVLGGIITWGALDPRLAPSDPEARRPGWSVRWSVRTLRAGTMRALATGAKGSVDRVLVREVLDTAKSVVHEEVVLHDVNAGTNARPGFRVEAQGAMWRIQISAGGSLDPANSTCMTFDVSLRN